nr:DUF3618 domain-containing protein [Phytoactinopolyspora mesophila]
MPKSRQPVRVQETAQEESDRRPKRSVDEIEQAMAERSERLSRNVDDLVNRMKPGRLARDGVQRVGSAMTTEQGGPRLEVIGAVAGAAVVAAFVIWRARRRR